MMKVTVAALIPFAAAIIAYAGGAFVTWQINPANWYAQDRMVCVIAAIFIMTMLLAIVPNDKATGA